MTGGFFARLKLDVGELPFGWALLALGVAGALTAIVALALHRRRQGLALGVTAIAIAIACAALGSLSVIAERGRTDEAVRSMTADGGRPVTEASRQRAKRAGYERARGGAQLGLLFSGAPLFGGLYAVLAPMVRRRKPQPRSMRMPRSIRSQARFEWGASTAGAASLAASAFAVLAVATCAVVWTLPLPGPQIDPEDPAWDARDAIDVMKTGALHEGCLRLVEACRGVCDEAKVPDLASAASECAHLRLDAFSDARDETSLAYLEELAAVRLPVSPAERVELDQALAHARDPARAPAPSK